MQFLNILFIEVTDEVLILLKFKEIKFLQPLNILLIDLTLQIFKLLKLKVVNELQL